MKRTIILILISAGLLSCSRNHLSDAYGNFEATEVTMSSEANGRIIFLDLEEGQDVYRGDTVGLVDTTDLSLRRSQLHQQVRVAMTRLDNIRSQIEVQEQQKKNLLVDKDRLEKLFKDGAATQKQMDDINGSLDLVEQQIKSTGVQKESVRAEIGTLQVQIEQVDESISKCWLLIPVNGTVLSKYAEEGEVTAFGKPVCKIADLGVMELKVYISGDQLPYLKIGQEVEVLIDKNKEDFRRLSGRVSWVSNKSEFTPKTIQTKEERVNLVYAAKVLVNNDGSLKIGMPGEINFMPE